MKKSIIRSCTVKIPVDNLKSSISFYKKVGFFIEETESTNYSVSTKMKFAEDSDFAICLTQALDEKFEEHHISFDLTPADVGDYGYLDTVELISQNGVEFENLKASEVKTVGTCCVIMKDPNGNTWSLNDEFDGID